MLKRLQNRRVEFTEKMETTIALKDDEIRDFRPVDITDARNKQSIHYTEENSSPLVMKNWTLLKVSSAQQAIDLETKLEKAEEASDMAKLASAEY